MCAASVSTCALFCVLPLRLMAVGVLVCPSTMVTRDLRRFKLDQGPFETVPKVQV